MKNIVVSFIKLSWFQKLLLFSIFAVVVSLVLKALTPAQSTNQSRVITNVADITTSYENVTFTGNAPLIPEKMNVGTLTNYETIPNEVKNNLISKFDLIQDPDKPNTWSGNGYQLYISKDQTLITLSQATDKNISNKKFDINEVESAINLSDSIMFDAFPEDTPKLVSSGINYLKGTVETEITKNASEADSVYIPYAYQLNNYPIYLEQDLSFVAYFIFDANKMLLKAEFRPYKISYSTGNNYKSLNLPFAMSNINNNNAGLIFTDSFGTGNSKNLDFLSGELNKVQIEYRADPVSNTIVPYYNFEGILKEKNDPNNDITVQIITPAIQTNFEKTSE